MTDYALDKDVAMLIFQRDRLGSFIGTKNRKEIVFAETLREILENTGFFLNKNQTIIYQYPIGRYRLDLYIPSYFLAIEYDEKYHNNKSKEDKEREKEIKRIDKNINFIRIKEGHELEGIGEIIKHIHECYWARNHTTKTNWGVRDGNR